MTVDELIKQLEALPPEMKVFMSSDPEGNRITNVAEAAVYEDLDNDYEDDAPETVVVIWPGYRELDQ